MALVEPIQGEPAAIADLGGETALVVADYHAGIERTFRQEGVEVRSQAENRREDLLDVLEETDPDRVLFLGDLGTHIGEPDGTELEELMDLEHVLRPWEVTLVPGNHDGLLGDVLDIEVVEGSGIRRGDVAFVHGHSWPGIEPLEADVLVVGHEHPCVRLEDEVGGSRIERVWLRGEFEAEPFETHLGESIEGPSELVVLPAYNSLAGGTWVNIEDQEFLSPFLPDASPAAEAYLLDGTRLGQYDEV